ncbi:MAG: hypothetical protein L0213_05605, partial [Candidatus Dadabacteria bacterium]|nr:hypothetical protein [Candidatus Dadabacteria bacterium]
MAEQGERKSTAKDIARDILVEAFPDLPIAPSVTTREAITKFLGGDESIRSFTDEGGTLVEYHPYVLFVKELKNFLSVNPGGMIDFLTDIYDRPHFIVETKNKGTDVIVNPSITFLACETTSWMIKKYKEDLITGGFSRRVNVIYEPENLTIIPRPMPPPGSEDLLKRIKEHLLKINSIVGRFEWTREGEKFFDDWYAHNRHTLPTDPVLRGYRRTKDVQLLKVAMLLALCEEEPKLVLTKDLLEVALATLDAAEKNLPKLTMSAGRNELALPQQRVLELISAHGGEMPEKQV